jgi:mono/diheme cytochrome c family protein
MDRNQAIIAVVAAVLVVFSLTVSMVVPKRNPGFPGKRLGIFFGITVLLVGGMLATVVVFGSEDAETEATPAAETVPAETGGETAPVETVAPGETVAPVETGASSRGDAAAGAPIFESAGCGSCHTLAAAGSTGNIGPNLDDAKPPYELVVDRVTNGKGVMPAFGNDGLLTAGQIQNVAAYVVQSTGG